MTNSSNDNLMGVKTETLHAQTTSIHAYKVWVRNNHRREEALQRIIELANDIKTTAYEIAELDHNTQQKVK